MKKNSQQMMLVFVFMCILLFFTSSKVYAYSASANKLNTNYTLTGNGAEDIYSVARAQLNKRYPEFSGFTYRAWCADFVSACAAAANVADVVPGAAAVSNLRRNIVKAGGIEYSKSQIQNGNYIPVRGDIIIFKSNGDSHVGIVDRAEDGKIYYIDGNNTTYGNGNDASVHYSNRAYSYAGFTCVVKPKYKNTGNKDNNSGVDPIGYLDSYSGGEGVVNISGWARDDDAPNQGIEIHVYIGGPSGSAGADGYPGIYANGYREDIGQHAYSARIKTNKRGRQNIYVYAINVGGGTNVLIGEGTVMIAESEPPKISNVRIENRSAKGYTIKCDVTDNVGIASVKFPTWTVQNGQDDLKWYEGIVSGNSAECTIDASNHNNETNCYYKTHIYADDTSGNESFFGIGETFVDSTPPTIYNVRIDNVTDKGFDISCKVSDNEGIARIKCPTWTRKNWQDDLSKDWQKSSLYDGKLDGNAVTYHVNTSDHNDEVGVYVVHIYVYDNSGNFSVSNLDVNVGEIEDSISPVDTVNYNGHTYMLFERTSLEGDENDRMVWQKVAAYCRSLGGTLACITSAEENSVVASMVKKYGSPCWIGGNNLENNNVYAWESGESFIYTNWDEGEPNNKTGDQHYIRMYPNGLWDDCEESNYAFICEFGKPVLSISNSTITLSDSEYIYDGKNKEPDVTVKYKNMVLKKDSDYSVSYSNNVNAGIANVIISGMGSYSGSAIENFTILKADQFITVDSSSIIMEENSTVKLNATGYGTLSYISRDEDILEINSLGEMTGKKAGNVIVDITADGNENYKYTSKEVTVMVEHKYREVIKEATCAEEGEKSAVCSICGITQEGSVERIPKLEHIWSEDYIIEKEATCVETGLKTFHCINCSITRTEEIPATGNHQNTELRNVREATCAEEGYTGDIYCKDCETKLYTGQKINKTEHKWDEGKVTQEANCVEEGVKTYTCIICKTTRSEEIPPTGIHTNTEIRNAKEATCAEEGYTGDTYCKDCGTQISTGQIIEKVAHTWDEGKTTKDATCIENGIKTYTCTVCQATKTEEISSTGHQHTELRNVKAATCAQEGYTGDTYCKDCNTKLSSGKSIAKKEHTWDLGKITTVATCSVKGIKTYTCVICQTTKTEVIPATGKHENTEVHNVKEATCAQEGYTGDTYCEDCGTLLSTGKSIPKTAHTWDAGKVTQKATCTTKGITTFTCTVCESTRTEEVPATGHTNKLTKFAKNASCKSEGYTGDIYCQDCGALLEDGKIISKTEHTWNAGEITKTATCTTAGVKTFTCTSCGTTRTEVIAATGHGTTEIRNEKTASCSSEGYTGDLYCTVCGQKISSGSVIAKTGHSWDNGVITKEPTAAEEGIKTYTCRNCGATQTETLAKLEPQTATPGKTIKDKATNGVYKVLDDGLSVEYTKSISKKASIKIPDTITVNGITCKVTKISANAFKNNASLKSITIGNNVITIGTNAFYGCKKLNKVSGGACIIKVGNKAFANCGSLSSITIPATARSIGRQAFYNCKRLRTIIVKTSALSSKNIGSKAFAGTYKKPTVKVPAKQMKAYKKLLKSKGMSSKAVYKK